MTVSRPRRPEADRGYHAQVGDFGGASERVELDADDDLNAVCTAFGAASPFGHAVGAGRRFLGYFEPGAARIARLTQPPAPDRRSWTGPPC